MFVLRPDCVLLCIDFFHPVAFLTPVLESKSPVELEAFCVPCVCLLHECTLIHADPCNSGAEQVS